MKITLEPFAEGESAPAYGLAVRHSRSFYELSVLAEDGCALPARVRIENIDGELRMYVWHAGDPPTEVMPAHAPPYSQRIVLAPPPAPPAQDTRIGGAVSQLYYRPT